MAARPSIAVFAAADDERAAVLAAQLGARNVSRAAWLVFPRPDVVFVCLPTAGLREAALFTTLARPRAVVCVASDGPPPPAPWMRRYHRILVASQDEARVWTNMGYALGRLVVLSTWEPPLLDALVAEVYAMGR